MEGRLIFLNPVELCEPSFREEPEGLNRVYVALSAGRLIFAVIGSVMVVAVEDESVLGLPSVRVNCAALKHFTL